MRKTLSIAITGDQKESKGRVTLTGNHLLIEDAEGNIARFEAGDGAAIASALVRVEVKHAETKPER